ncbi:carboxypeptidase Ss1. Metallo peptidase. MEROPS family M20D [Hymenobacter roseosalivarius DSM 11622]|uniref:Carboxypeptidase Ss1. Metallo peptidase. MEROPS family M20D n=1 Tax=Hymenobacter roseosalivarius DSM 11622 TaxID=645990 RepID=A0A1W1VLM5_9BACT|nr:amidohydrolase [Hymenobacter roseosalivarius]SMB94285.1 carboxypeptidase Ss1. Metallo peptidase. MEROPS family M20D [Hymenobacter roseosalivarius DSM 11622]
MKSIYPALTAAVLFAGFAAAPASAQNAALDARIAKLAQQQEAQVIAWRRDFHEHAELGNQETRTAGIVAAHLKKLGLEVQTGVARTGVVGILRGGKPGPVVALRADMDGLPVTENNELTFRSKATATYNGQQVGVMHACGHDSHVAMLLGAAEVLSQVKKDLPGTVKFIFQPAEEGSLPGEEGGAKLMVKEGVLDNPKVDAIFGVHVNAQTEVGTLKYRPAGMMASSDVFTIKVKGKSAHGAYPWLSVDPVVTSAQIITGLQTIISRQTELTEDAAVITVGMIHGGVRNNIIPEQVELTGTIRTLNKEMQAKIWADIRRTATKIAESAGATAEVDIVNYAPVTYNDPRLTERMVPTLRTAAGAANKVVLQKAVTGAEDFAYYQEKVPGVFVFVGGMSKGTDPATTAPHHTPGFRLDESGFTLGVKTLAMLAADYLTMKK